MKKKTVNNDDEIVTRGILKKELKELKEKFKNHPKKVEMGIALENLRSAVRGDVEELLTHFRSDMFTRYGKRITDLEKQTRN